MRRDDEHPRFACPAVTEIVRAVEVVSRDPFLDGLAGAVAPRAAADAGSVSASSRPPRRRAQARCAPARAT